MNKFLMFLSRYRLLRPYFYLVQTIYLPSRILNFREYLRRRRKKMNEFKIGDMVRVIKPTRKVEIFLGPEVQEMVEPYQLGKTSTHNPEFKQLVNVGTGPLSIDNLLFERREPFRVVEIEFAYDESTLALLWDCIIGHNNKVHPQLLKLRNDAVVYGEKETEFLTASIFEKVEPQ